MLLYSSIRPFLLRILFSLVVLGSNVPAQENAEEKEDKSPILLRVLCKQPVAGATDLKIVQGEQAIHALEITPSLMTDPIAVNRGDLLLARTEGGGEKPTFNHVLKINIPNEGKRFVLAIFASPEPPSPDKPYQFRLVRTDGLRFGASDLYLFNLTPLPIAGVLGQEKFALAPEASKVVTPKPEDPEGQMYQSRFYCQIGDQAKVFNDTRWPVAASARVYLFFIPDPERKSIGYLSFREYEPFP